MAALLLVAAFLSASLAASQAAPQYLSQQNLIGNSRVFHFGEPLGVYLVLEVLFLSVAFSSALLWCYWGKSKTTGRAVQWIALIAAIVLLYPCISLADDFREQQQPLDVPVNSCSVAKHNPALLNAAPAALPAVISSYNVNRRATIFLLEESSCAIAPVLHAGDIGLRAPPQN